MSYGIAKAIQFHPGAKLRAIVTTRITKFVFTCSEEREKTRQEFNEDNEGIVP
jgi:hypothetical protein